MEPTDRTTTTNVGGNGHAEKARRAEASAHEKVDRTQSSVHSTVDRAARGAHETVDRIADKATQYASRMGEKSGELSQQKDRLMAETRTYVQTHPVAAIGIAVAAGFVLSRLLRSDPHDRY